MKRARSLQKASNAVIDAQYYGDEPTLTTTSTDHDIISFYNWHNYIHTADDAKTFVVDYFKATIKKLDVAKSGMYKDMLKKVMNVDANKVRTIGWGLRNLSLGGTLPQNIEDDLWSRLNKVLDTVEVVEPVVAEAAAEPASPVISIQERVEKRAGELIAELEVQIDKFATDGKNEFDPAAWFRNTAIKPMIAKKISEYYQPLYSEMFDAYSGKDEDLKYAYRKWKKPALKKYIEFVKSIISAAETTAVINKTVRKPRKKKVKPAAEIVSKLKFKEKDDGSNLSSVNPVGIVGANQLWTYNTRTRTLSVYMAIGPTGLSVKGTTITGFDEKTSISKTLRKPQETITKVLDGGKIILKKLMDDLTTKPKNATGRINSDTILLRVVK